MLHTAGRRLSQPRHYVEKRALACAVAADDTHLLASRELIGEAVEDSFVAVGEIDVVAVDDLASETRLRHIDIHAVGAQRYRRTLFEIVERIDPVTRLARACLRRGAYPLQLAAQQVARLVYVGLHVCVTLLAPGQIVRVAALVDDQLAAVDLEDRVAHPIQKIAVVRNHKQRAARALQIRFEILDDLYVEVVRRLVEDQKVSLLQHHHSQRHALGLTARQLAHAAVGCVDMERGQYLPYILLDAPTVPDIHCRRRRVHASAVARSHGLVILAHGRRPLVETRIHLVEHASIGVERRRLV